MLKFNAKRDVPLLVFGAALAVFGWQLPLYLAGGLLGLVVLSLLAAWVMDQ